MYKKKENENESNIFFPLSLDIILPWSPILRTWIAPKDKKRSEFTWLEIGLDLWIHQNTVIENMMGPGGDFKEIQEERI